MHLLCAVCHMACQGWSGEHIMETLHHCGNTYKANLDGGFILVHAFRDSIPRPVGSIALDQTWERAPWWGSLWQRLLKSWNPGKRRDEKWPGQDIPSNDYSDQLPQTRIRNSTALPPSISLLEFRMCQWIEQLFRSELSWCDQPRNYSQKHAELCSAKTGLSLSN